MPLNRKILLVSNQQTTLPLGIFGLGPQRFQVIMELHPAKALERWSEETPDLIMFDSDGMELLALDMIRQLRGQAVIPILWMASNQTERSVLDAYEAGVDEYILKPILPSILQAKIRAWLRRSSSVPVEMLDSLSIGNVRCIPSDRIIVFEGRDPIRLTSLEMRLMFYLMSHADRTVTAEELCQRVWGNQGDGNKTALKNVIYRLRHKIEADQDHPHYISTVAGVGYQFKLK